MWGVVQPRDCSLTPAILSSAKNAFRSFPLKSNVAPEGPKCDFWNQQGKPQRFHPQQAEEFFKQAMREGRSDEVNAQLLQLTSRDAISIAAHKVRCLEGRPAEMRAGSAGATLQCVEAATLGIECRIRAVLYLGHVARRHGARPQ